jgi:Na+-transporting methylmalonyl-CoA/oxaloacetate decarboxylase gamma subunit
MNLLAALENATPEPVNGIGIAITGMSIVFVALLLICGFLTALPRLMKIVDHYYPEQIHQTPAPATPSNQVEDEVVVAIGAALQRHRSN